MKLVETLPDGRHKTNLKLLITLPKVRRHFKEMSRIVSKQTVARQRLRDPG